MRPRRQNRNLPSCVYLKSGTYYYVRKNKWINLGKELAAALTKYAKLSENVAHGGMPLLIEQAMPSICAGKAKNTQAQYQRMGDQISKIFAEFEPIQVTARDIVQVRRAFADKPNSFNRLLTVLRLVFDFALEEMIVDTNPAVQVKKLKEGRRDRLLSMQEYDAIYKEAPDRLKAAMELMRLTGQRVQDVLQIKYADLGDEGIAFKQQKTGKKLIVAWTPELETVVEFARNLNPKVKGLTLLQGRDHGKPVDYHSTQDQWLAACKRAGVKDAQLRDLRAFAATSAKRQGLDATALLGHASSQMTQRYLRDKEAAVVHAPSFRKKP